MTRKKYARTRQILDFSDLIARQGEYALLCAPTIAIMVARQLIETRGLWCATYAKSYSENYYTAPTREELQPIREAIAEFTEQTHDMSICNDLITSLNEIADKMCCGGAADQDGASVYEQSGSYYFGDEAPASEPGVFGPGEEFETEGEYLAHKCAAANGIVNGMIATLNNWSVLSVASLTVGAIVLGITFPLLAAVPVAIFLSLAALGVSFGVFSTIANAIDENRVTLVCGLYNSTSATQAYDLYYETVEGLVVGLGFAEVEVSAIMAILTRLGTTDAMNALFQAVGLPSITEAVDCDAVCGEPWWTCLSGTLVSSTADTVTVDSRLVSGLYYAAIAVAANTTLSAEDVTGWSDTPNNDTRLDDNSETCGQGSGYALVFAGLELGPHVGYQLMNVRSSTPFRITFRES